MIRWLMVCLFGLIAVGALFVVFQNVRNQQNLEAVYAVATKVGYTPQARLTELTPCWDFKAHCGIALYFSTDHNQQSVDSQISQLGLKEVLSHEVDGRKLFTELTVTGGHEMSVNGQAAKGHTLPNELVPASYEWWLNDQQGRNIFITLYTVDTQQKYTFDGQLISSNVLSVMVQTR